LKHQGTYSALENAPSYDEINQIMAREIHDLG